MADEAADLKLVRMHSIEVSLLAKSYLIIYLCIRSDIMIALSPHEK